MLDEYSFSLYCFRIRLIQAEIKIPLVGKNRRLKQKTQKNNIAGLPDINVPWSEEELEQFKKDKNYFVSLDNHVYKNDKDYAFKRLQHRSIENRDVFKYTGQKIEAELITKIDELIEKRKNEAA